MRILVGVSGMRRDSGMELAHCDLGTYCSGSLSYCDLYAKLKKVNVLQRQQIITSNFTKLGEFRKVL